MSEESDLDTGPWLTEAAWTMGVCTYTACPIQMQQPFEQVQDHGGDDWLCP